MEKIKNKRTRAIKCNKAYEEIPHQGLHFGVKEFCDADPDDIKQASSFNFYYDNIGRDYVGFVPRIQSVVLKIFLQL